MSIASFFRRLVGYSGPSNADLSVELETLHDRFNKQEFFMSDISSSIASLRTAVAGVASRVGELSTDNVEKVAELQNALENERSAAAALNAAEDAEDVAQNQALADAKAETDRIMESVTSAAADIDEQVVALDQVAAAPAGEEPTEEPTDEPTDPVDPPVEEPTDPVDPQDETPVDETPVDEAPVDGEPQP